MTSLNDLRAMAERGDLTHLVKERELDGRAALMRTLVGNLYPSILQAEIDEISALTSRPPTVFDYVLDS